MGYQPSLRDIILAFFRRRTLIMLVCGAVFLAGGADLLLKQSTPNRNWLSPKTRRRAPGIS
jgi:hypothetical protein